METTKEEAIKWFKSLSNGMQELILRKNNLIGGIPIDKIEQIYLKRLS